MPEAAEGALPQAPGPAIPPEIGARGAAAGQAAAEAQPNAALQPVQVCWRSGNHSYAPFCIEDVQLCIVLADRMFIRLAWLVPSAESPASPRADWG